MPRPARAALTRAGALTLLALSACEPLVVEFSGEGEVRSTPDPIDAGDLFVGVSRSVTVVVSNVGGGEGDWVIEGDGGTVLHLVPGPSSVELAPGDSQEVTVAVTALTWGDLQGSLRICTQDGVDLARITVTAAAQVDDDGDGHGSLATGGDDCDDANPDVYPGAIETWYDGVDADCAGDDDLDRDADGVRWDEDCDDDDADVGAAAEEVWNGVDDDCNGIVDDLPVEGATSGTVWGEDGIGLGGATSMAFGVGLLGDGAPVVVLTGTADGVGGGGVWILPLATLDGAESSAIDLAQVALAGATADPLGTLAPRLGDVTADGVDDLIIGTTAGEADGGYARVYVLEGGDLATQRELATVALAEITGDTANDDLHVGLASDLDGDGVSELVVGAPDDQANGEDEGGAGRAGSIAWFQGPIPEGSLDLDDADARIRGDETGQMLGAAAIAVDLDRDGYGEILVAAPGDDSGGRGAGMVHRLAGPALLDGDNDIDAVSVARWAGGEADEQLGLYGLSGAGDLDGDGTLDLALGSQAKGGVAVWLDAGSVTGLHAAFDADARWWLGESCGWALAADGDIDHDGVDDLLVGCPENDAMGESAGSVWWLDARAPKATPRAVLFGAAGGDLLGSALLAGLPLEDGHEGVLIGAPGRGGDQAGSGAIYLVHPE